MAKKRIQTRTHGEWPKFLGLGILILIVYANSFAAGFVFDSVPIVQDDPRLRSLTFENLGRIFTLNYWWPSQYTPLYRPFTTLSYLFNYAVLGNGENVVGYHVVNFLLHWTNAWLVFVIVRRLAGRRDVAALSACLFAVHPVNTEAVTNIVGRADLLATLCVLFGGWCYLKSLESGAQWKTWLALLAVSACLGVVAKENAVMILGFIALYDFLWRWPERSKIGFAEFARPYIALVPSLLLIWSIRQWMSGRVPVFGEFFMDNPLIGAPAFQGFMTAMGVIGRYLQLLIFPWTLSSDYSFNQIPVRMDLYAIISVAAVAILIVTALWLRQRQKLFSWGILFLFAMMLPTSNLLVKIGSIMAERFLYLPSIGFCAVAALALCAVGERLGRSRGVARWALPALAVIALGSRAYARNADWHDELSLWRSTVAASPASFKSHMGYGDAIWTAAQQNGTPLSDAIDQTIAEEETARRIIEPNPPIPLKSQSNSVYLRLGRYYRVKGEFLDGAGRRDEAASLYHKSVESLERAQMLDRLNNDNWREFRLSRGVAPQDIPVMGNFAVYQQLGLTYTRLGDLEKCETAGRYLQQLVPDQAIGYQLVGNAYYNLHRYSEAAVQLIAGLLVEPNNTDSWANVTLVYNALAIQPNPISQQGGVMSLNPRSPVVRQHLNDASLIVVRQLESAQQFDRARELQDQLIKEYAVPPELFQTPESQ
jgi:protein O-mannosyl-transferase